MGVCSEIHRQQAFCRLEIDGYKVISCRFKDVLWGIYMTVMEQTIKSLVLDRVRQAPLRPTELVRELSDEAYPSEVENALSGLLDEGAVVFGSDRKLSVAETFAGVV